MVSMVNIAEAKSHLTRLVRQAEQGECVHLSRHGKPVAVLLSEKDYQALVSQHVDPYQAMMAWRTQADFSGEDITDEEVEGWRSREVERVFSWEE
jgi:prevent-host-death family protein